MYDTTSSNEEIAGAAIISLLISVWGKGCEFEGLSESEMNHPGSLTVAAKQKLQFRSQTAMASYAYGAIVIWNWNFLNL